MNIDDIELKNAIQSNGHGVDNPGFEAEVGALGICHLCNLPR